MVSSPAELYKPEICTQCQSMSNEFPHEATLEQKPRAGLEMKLTIMDTMMVVDVSSRTLRQFFSNSTTPSG